MKLSNRKILEILAFCLVVLIVSIIAMRFLFGGTSRVMIQNNCNVKIRISTITNFHYNYEREIEPGSKAVAFQLNDPFEERIKVVRLGPDQKTITVGLKPGQDEIDGTYTINISDASFH